MNVRCHNFIILIYELLIISRFYKKRLWFDHDWVLSTSSRLLVIWKDSFVHFQKLLCRCMWSFGGFRNLVLSIKDLCLINKPGLFHQFTTALDREFLKLRSFVIWVSFKVFTTFTTFRFLRFLLRILKLRMRFWSQFSILRICGFRLS